MKKEMLKNYLSANLLRCLQLEGIILRDKWMEHPLLNRLPIPPQIFFKMVAGAVYPFQGLTHIPHIDLSVGTKCSLKCKYCTQWSPYIDHPEIYSADEIIHCMTHLLKNVDHVHRVALLGGEVFLNKEWDKILDFLLIQNKVGRVLVITNATIYPNLDARAKLKHKKVEVWIDNYGDRSRYAAKWRSYCRRNNIKYRYETAKTWWDIGILKEKQMYNTNEIKETWDNCWLRNCTTLIDGILYRCGRQWVLENNALETPEKQESISIKSVRSKKEMLQKLFQFYGLDMIHACAWCNSKHNRPVIKAGEQL